MKLTQEQFDILLSLCGHRGWTEPRAWPLFRLRLHRMISAGQTEREKIRYSITEKGRDAVREILQQIPHPHYRLK